MPTRNTVTYRSAKNFDYLNIEQEISCTDEDLESLQFKLDDIQEELMSSRHINMQQEDEYT
jgi:hypothetical protein